MSEKKETPILKAEHLTKMFPVKGSLSPSWERPVPASPRWPERSLR